MNENDALQGRVPGRLIRGGTSKGFFVTEAALPTVEEDVLDALVLELFGTPDPLQIDGIGGSHSHTSKLMIVDDSGRDGVDVEYTFGQVGIDTPVVDWTGNCGNLTSAVGSFAIREGLVAPTTSPASVTLYNTNTGTRIDQAIPLEDGVPTPYGEYRVDGVPGRGARVDSTFHDPAGGVLGSLFPTGERRETVEVDGTRYEVSLVDVANPCVFVRADALGLDGTELPAELAAHGHALETLELIRGRVCERLGLVEDASDARTERPTTPFVAVVAGPRSYDCSDGGAVAAADVDVTARIVTSQSPHHAYAVTGAMCLAAAARLEGTIPNGVVSGVDDRVTIGHPRGTITIGVSSDGETVESVTVGRTVRELMRGEACYRYVGELAALS